ncbi:MAG TPA: adenylate/guanylate cyclase domain-containing protein [Stellaceae bacterium]|jgi:class 3 adenylate cyclase|nr:adenylate/guanylate cyclase domain-containing protein [Stellaceae bacterium]
MEGLPATVAERLQASIFSERAVAYLHVDAGLTLVDAGGHLEAYGLAGLRSGEPVAEQAFFLEGLLPPVEKTDFVPSVELASGRAADLHFFMQDDAYWVVLLDVSAERDAAGRMQQKAYDMTLAQEREALLNRRLEAANAELLATQRELEASHDALARAHDQVQAQAAELAAWNKTLEERVAAQLAELERMARLKRFFAPTLAELIVSSGNERILESHRRDIAVLFCDLRGFTAFAESAEPEEVMTLLHEYHAALVPLIQTFEGTLDRFVGDGLMVYFNDPLPCPNPAERAVALAVAMRDAVAALAQKWRRHDYRLGFGIGIAQGFATLGQIGFEGRFDYSAIGTVINTAARLCEAAKDGQILVISRVAAAVAEAVDVREIGPLTFKGLSRPLAVCNVEALKVAQ